MDYRVLFVLTGITAITTRGVTLDNCPPADPNCHPTCVVYTADHCRYCMCNHGSKNFESKTSSDQSTDAAWDRGFEGGDWSNKVNSDASAWSNTDHSGFTNDYSSSGDSSSANKEIVKYVIVEKQPEQTYSDTGLPSGLSSLSSLPNPFPAGLRSPFAGSHMSSSLLPGASSITDLEAYGSNVIRVPLLAPGVPKYCVRCRILSCPRTCERIDEYGCRSCPCAPSRYQTMPVLKECSNSKPIALKTDCAATKLCMETCSDGYQLGDVGQNGCRSCSCIRKAPKTTPKPNSNSCIATLSCMLKCKDGYLLGETQANGCQSCKCLAKHQGQLNSSNKNNANTFDNNNNSFNNKDNNNKWNTGSSNWNNNNNNNINNNNNNAHMMSSWNSGSGSSGNDKGCSGNKRNYLKSNNGIGSGKCEPPMCLDGHMSVEQAMTIGSESAGGGGGCSEGGGMSGNGMNTGSNGMNIGGNGMNMGGNGMNMGGNGMNMGGNGMNMGGNGIGNGGMGTGSSSASGKGMPSPFTVPMSGSNGGGMSMKGGSGGIRGSGTGSGMPFSPFSSAMSKGGQDKDRSLTVGALSRVTSIAYNKGCIGAECSAKNSLQHKDCADLVHCLITCEGSYVLGQLDDAGCQTCSCTD